MNSFKAILFLLIINLCGNNTSAQEKRFYKTITIGEYTYCRPRLNDSSVVMFCVYFYQLKTGEFVSN